MRSSKYKGTTRKLTTTHLVRLSTFAYNRLWKACAAFQLEVLSKPHEHPVHAGRRITLSDTVVALTEGRTE